ncbi:MAG: cupredoxin domain-containing protein [Trebonia sp.]
MHNAKTSPRSRVTRRWLLGAVFAVAVVLTGCTSAGMGSVTPVAPASSAAPASSSAPPSSAAPTAPATSAAAGSGGAKAASCAPSGTSLQVSAHNIKFDKSCLAAPANQAFTITFDNMDAGVPHNVDIYTNSSATTSLFKGAVVTGPTTTTYHVPALKSGTYYFRCDIHPTQMFGTFIVG